MANAKELVALHEEARSIEMALFSAPEDIRTKYQKRLDQIRRKIDSIRDHERNLRMRSHDPEKPRRDAQPDLTSFVQANINPGPRNGLRRAVPTHNDQASDSRGGRIFFPSPSTPTQTGRRRQNSNSSQHNLLSGETLQPYSNVTLNVAVNSSPPSRMGVLYSNQPTDVAARSSLSQNQRHSTSKSFPSYAQLENKLAGPSRREPPVPPARPTSYHPAFEKALEHRGRRRSPRRHDAP